MSGQEGCEADDAKGPGEAQAGLEGGRGARAAQGEQPHPTEAQEQAPEARGRLRRQRPARALWPRMVRAHAGRAGRWTMDGCRAVFGDGRVRCPADRARMAEGRRPAASTARRRRRARHRFGGSGVDPTGRRRDPRLRRDLVVRGLQLRRRQQAKKESARRCRVHDSVRTLRRTRSVVYGDHRPLLAHRGRRSRVHRRRVRDRRLPRRLWRSQSVRGAGRRRDGDRRDDVRDHRDRPQAVRLSRDRSRSRSWRRRCVPPGR